MIFRKNRDFRDLCMTCMTGLRQRNALDCEMCKLAVKSADGDADKDTNDIKKDFDAKCKKAFHSIQFAPRECEHYVDKKLDPIIKELESGTSPKDVCTKLGECS